MTDDRAPLPQLARDILLRDVAGLPPRAYYPLANNDITTVGQVAMLTDRELLRIGGLGRVLVRGIRAVIPYWTEHGVRDDRCEVCRWWDGRCHRHAPRIANLDTAAIFPRTAPTDWCGDFEVRKASEMMRNRRQPLAEVSP